jgi:hypothetical protein
MWGKEFHSIIQIFKLNDDIVMICQIYLQESNYQDTVMMGSYLGKCFQEFIKYQNALDENSDPIGKHAIPSVSRKEANALGHGGYLDSGKNISRNI